MAQFSNCLAVHLNHIMVTALVYYAKLVFNYILSFIKKRLEKILVHFVKFWV